MKKLGIAMLVIFIMCVSVQAEEMIIPINMVDSLGVGKMIGTITASSSPYGVIFTPNLSGLNPGLHGFHVHENPNCGPAMKGGKMVPGLAASGHYDPAAAGRHEGPYGSGHLGDLPALYVDVKGNATHPVVAPRLKVSDLRGRSLVIHAGGDNYSDYPKKFGGGGARVACGVLE
jgi:Cu-Zn family superoxide dismutase